MRVGPHCHCWKLSSRMNGLMTSQPASLFDAITVGTGSRNLRATDGILKVAPGVGFEPTSRA